MKSHLQILLYKKNKDNELAGKCLLKQMSFMSFLKALTEGIFLITAGTSGGS